MEKEQLIDKIIEFKPEGMTKVILKKMTTEILVSIYNGLIPDATNTLFAEFKKISNSDEGYYKMEHSSNGAIAYFEEKEINGIEYYILIAQKLNIGHPKLRGSKTEELNEKRMNTAKFGKHSLGDAKTWFSFAASEDTK